MNSTEKFLKGMADYNQTMHSLIATGHVVEHGTIDIDWDEPPPSDQKGVAMPNRWDSRWDHWCHLRANNPSRGEWWWLVAVGLALVGLIAAGVKCWMLLR